MIEIILLSFYGLGALATSVAAAMGRGLSEEEWKQQIAEVLKGRPYYCMKIGCNSNRTHGEHLLKTRKRKYFFASCVTVLTWPIMVPVYWGFRKGQYMSQVVTARDELGKLNRQIAELKGEVIDIQQRKKFG